MKKKNRAFLLLAFASLSASLIIFGIVGVFRASFSNAASPFQNINKINWAFSRTDGSLISGKIIFNRNGKIKYSPSYNEVFWKIENDSLTLMNGAKQPATVFDKIYKKRRPLGYGRQISFR